jgi:hypothetical protein
MEMEVVIWREGGYDRTFVTDPATGDVAEALSLLNGEERNDLYLRTASGRWMGFGGGPDEVIVTYSEALEGPHFQAVQAVPQEGQPVSVMVGGQEVAMPREYLIEMEAASQAAITFAETGQRPESLDWKPC